MHSYVSCFALDWYTNPSSLDDDMKSGHLQYCVYLSLHVMPACCAHFVKQARICVVTTVVWTDSSAILTEALCVSDGV